MKIVIKRLEGEFAVVELPNGEQKICPIEVFPATIKEGAIVKIEIDSEEN